MKSILVFIEVGEHDISGRTDYQIYDFNRECRRLKRRMILGNLESFKKYTYLLLKAKKSASNAGGKQGDNLLLWEGDHV